MPMTLPGTDARLPSATTANRLARYTDAAGTHGDALISWSSGTLRLGDADAAIPVAQTVTAQGVVAGTSNTAGAALTIKGSASTGTGVGGNIQFAITKAGTTGTAQNAYFNAWYIDGATGNILANTDGSFSIGAFGANRPDSIFAKTQVFCGGNIFGLANFYIGPANDVIVGRGQSTAAFLQLGGATDAAAPIAQQLGAQSVVAGTSNTAAPDFTIRAPQGTGTGAGGNLVFKVAPAGSSGTAQNAVQTAMTIKPDKGVVGASYVGTISTTVALLPAAATAGSGARAFVTDASATTFLSTAAGGGANKVPVVSDGTNWLIG